MHGGDPGVWRFLRKPGIASASRYEDYPGAGCLRGGLFTAGRRPAWRWGRRASPYQSLPEFCRVAATLTPSSDSDIKVEVWLPAGWNRKFQAVGNGGWAGTISYSAMAEAIKLGYATASTDTGHSTAGGAFVLGIPRNWWISGGAPNTR